MTGDFATSCDARYATHGIAVLYIPLNKPRCHRRVELRVLTVDHVYIYVLPGIRENDESQERERIPRLVTRGVCLINTTSRLCIAGKKIKLGLKLSGPLLSHAVNATLLALTRLYYSRRFPWYRRLDKALWSNGVVFLSLSFAFRRRKERLEKAQICADSVRGN